MNNDKDKQRWSIKHNIHALYSYMVNIASFLFLFFLVPFLCLGVWNRVFKMAGFADVTNDEVQN